MSTPLTPAGGSVEWTIEVAVPEEVEGLIVLPTVDSKQQRLYVNFELLGAYVCTIVRSQEETVATRQGDVGWRRRNRADD